MKRNNALIIVSLASLLISGCSSLGKGITEAILEKQEAEDTRVCEVWGQEFSGLNSNIVQNQGKMKVLMVHGVGDHKPGYATQFFEKLAKELDLTVTSRVYKDIQLNSPAYPDESLGNLRIKRFLSKDKSRELILYELTWSNITAKEKEVLAYDNSGEYSFRRAAVNDMMKRFSNDTGPDPIIYLGESRPKILTSFAQSFCWMTSADWQGIPIKSNAVCKTSKASTIDRDQYAFFSHSLGSRIAMDGMQRIASTLSNGDPQYEKIKNALRNKTMPIYMMSNQLPMLQLGRKLPEVHGQKDRYCRKGGDKYSERILTKTPVIAFSDPNDLLSYPIPQGFVEKYLDSRLCIDVTNININIAFVYDVFGLGKMANPMDAHIGYDMDDRVVALIAKGIGNAQTAEIVNKRCRWIETID